MTEVCRFDEIARGMQHGVTRHTLHHLSTSIGGDPCVVVGADCPTPCRGRMKIFSVDEAEGTLPLVRRIAEDLTDEYPRWRSAVADYEMLSGAAKADDGETDELLSARQNVMAHAERINECLRELEQVGCVFKGFENGLVDFYALHEDRLVFLCWRLGEEHVSHWHEVDTGFAGREPIDDVLMFCGSHTEGSSLP